MPCPASGEIRLAMIRQELESTGTSDDYNDGPWTTNTTTSKNCNTFVYDSRNSNSDDYPDGVAPYKMTEFYSYDHNASEQAG